MFWSHFLSLIQCEMSETLIKVEENLKLYQCRALWQKSHWSGWLVHSAFTKYHFVDYYSGLTVLSTLTQHNMPFHTASIAKKVLELKRGVHVTWANNQTQTKRVPMWQKYKWTIVVGISSELRRVDANSQNCMFPVWYWIAACSENVQCIIHRTKLERQAMFLLWCATKWHFETEIHGLLWIILDK